LREPIEVGSSGNPNFIEVRHGKMLISVPRSIFKGRTSALKKKEADEFKKVLASRYPWLSANAIEVVMVEAQDTIESLLEMEMGEVERARKLASQGRNAEALTLLEEHLERLPKDPDAWLVMGEIYMRMGERSEGFKAFAKARGHSGSADDLKRKGR
jgi:cytochrome c-type biogenesis protein CcmH/NrfG